MTVAQPQQPAINPKALTWTILVHALLLLLFFIWRYTIPVMNVDTGTGLEVNLGSSDNGSGTDQPQSKDNPSVVYKNADMKSDLPKNMLQSTDASDPSLNNPGKTKNIAGVAPGKDNAQVKPVPKSVFTGTKNGGNNALQNTPGSNEGNTTGPGDRGVPGGTPGAPNYTGVPGTGGIGHTLSGREITPKRLEAEFREGGKVVIHVTVDRDGNIVNKFVKSSSNAALTKIALEKLAKAKFSKSTSSEPQQFGDVTIIFKTR